MAGGKDQKDANAMIRQTQAKTNAGSDALQTRNNSDLDEAKQRATDLYGTLRNSYGSLASGAVPPGAAPSAVGNAGGGGGGGAPAPAALPDSARGGRNALMEESLGGYRDFAKTGGWDANRTASMDQNIAGLKSIGQTGGINDADAARMRGGGVYDEYAKTGGLSDADRSNIRTRATSTIPSMFGSLKNEANRAATVQGGYGPGRSALMSRFGRQQAGAGADAALNAELGIADRVNSGRLAGAGGMAQSEGALQSLRTGNQLAGLRGASDVESGMVNSVNQGKMFGTQGVAGQGEADRAAAMGARDADLRERSLGMAGSAQAQSQANWERAFAADQQNRGLEGLSSLYGGQGSGEYNFNKGYGLDTVGQQSGMGLAAGSQLKSGNKSWMDYAAPIMGAAAGGLTGGLSSFLPRGAMPNYGMSGRGMPIEQFGG